MATHVICWAYRMDLNAAPVNVYNKMLAGIWGCSTEEEKGITLNVLDIFVKIMGNPQNNDFKYFEFCNLLFWTGVRNIITFQHDFCFFSWIVTL